MGVDKFRMSGGHGVKGRDGSVSMQLGRYAHDSEDVGKLEPLNANLNPGAHLDTTSCEVGDDPAMMKSAAGWMGGGLHPFTASGTEVDAGKTQQPLPEAVTLDSPAGAQLASAWEMHCMTHPTESNCDTEYGWAAALAPDSPE